jgi:hypothetical protein
MERAAQSAPGRLGYCQLLFIEIDLPVNFLIEDFDDRLDFFFQ